MSIEKNIKKLRKARGLTQTQLAEQIGTRQKVIADYERATSKPPRERLLTLARFFNLSVEELLGDDVTPVQGTTMNIHGNTRTAKMVTAFEQLSVAEQRLILKQTEALASSHTTK